MCVFPTGTRATFRSRMMLGAVVVWVCYIGEGRAIGQRMPA